MEGNRESMIPKQFFVTSGKAVSQVSKLNAFDRALKDAGIAQCNLVPVTSIIPPECKETKQKEIPIGSITHAVIAKMAGNGKTKISVGIAWVWEKNRKYGMVAEAHGCMSKKSIAEKLEFRLREMAKAREIKIGIKKYRTEVLTVPEGSYGCVMAALVYHL
jgi:arginine decarboxylase